MPKYLSFFGSDPELGATHSNPRPKKTFYFTLLGVGLSAL